MAAQRPRDLESVEVRPLGSRASATSEAAARAWLEDRSQRRVNVQLGDVFTAGGQEFAVTACEPTGRGLLVPSSTTLSVVAGPPVPALKRVQLSYMGSQGDAGNEDGAETSALYDQYIRPQLIEWRNARRRDAGHYFAVLVKDRLLSASGKDFAVRFLDPDGRLGAIDETTLVFITYIETPSLRKVHVLPYEDTLPAAYQFNLFYDFLQPFMQAHPCALYGEGDHFTYRGVRFRVMATDPPHVSARLSSDTMVFFEGESLRPTIWDLITPELRDDLSRLPRGLQVLLLNTMANEEAVQNRLMEVHEVLRRGQGVTADQIEACGRVSTWSADAQRGQNNCMVCLCDFVDGDSVRELGCGHVYHKSCIDEWLRRSPACPICKRPAVQGGGATSEGTGEREPARPSNNIATSAMLLVGTRVACLGAAGTVVGVDVPSQMFRISLDGNPEEQLVALSDAVQQTGVTLTGLRTTELNGQSAQVVGFDAARERYRVQVDTPVGASGDEMDRVLGVRPDNCILPEGAVARVVGLRPEGPGASWNGHYGRVVGFDQDRARHLLSMEASPGARRHLLSVKANNLRL